VLVGPYDGLQLPIVVRNNTDEDLFDITVSAVARTADGELIAAGGDQHFNPYRVPSGDYALGYTSFDGVEPPADAVSEIDVDGSSEASSFSPIDLEAGDAEFLSDRIVGELINNNDATIGSIGISVICLDSEGAVTSFQSGYVDKESTDPGETVPFQVSFFGDVDCSTFVFTGNGYEA